MATVLTGSGFQSCFRNFQRESEVWLGWPSSAAWPWIIGAAESWSDFDIRTDSCVQSTKWFDQFSKYPEFVSWVDRPTGCCSNSIRLILSESIQHVYEVADSMSGRRFAVLRLSCSSSHVAGRQRHKVSNIEPLTAEHYLTQTKHVPNIEYRVCNWKRLATSRTCYRAKLIY